MTNIHVRVKDKKSVGYFSAIINTLSSWLEEF